MRVAITLALMLLNLGSGCTTGSSTSAKPPVSAIIAERPASRAEMVTIPGGMFSAGSQDEKDNLAHDLEIGTFSIDKYEVTQADYEKVMGSNPSNFKNCPSCPVEQVQWIEADTYCKKVGKRLPTEWEWEKAAKGGKNVSYHWGDKEDGADRFAWYDKNSDEMTHPVGQKEPNGYGLYDMAGNVWEWTESDYNNDVVTALNILYVFVNPIGAVAALTSREKVLRGGSWSRDPYYLRLAYRDHRAVSAPLDPILRHSTDGFRCAKSEQPEKEVSKQMGIKQQEIEIPKPEFQKPPQTTLSTPTAVVQAAPEKKTDLPMKKKEECFIKGAILFTNKIYFKPENENYKDVTINSERGEKMFCTEEEAKLAGFLPSKK